MLDNLAPFSNIQPIPQLNCLSCLTYPQHTYQSDRKKQKYIFVGKTREISNNDGVKFLKDKEKASIIRMSKIVVFHKDQKINTLKCNA